MVDDGNEKNGARRGCRPFEPEDPPRTAYRPDLGTVNGAHAGFGPFGREERVEGRFSAEWRRLNGGRADGQPFGRPKTAGDSVARDLEKDVPRNGGNRVVSGSRRFVGGECDGDEVASSGVSNDVEQLDEGEVHGFY